MKLGKRSDEKVETGNAKTQRTFVGHNITRRKRREPMLSDFRRDLKLETKPYRAKGGLRYSDMIVSAYNLVLLLSQATKMPLPHTGLKSLLSLKAITSLIYTLHIKSL